VTTLLTICRAVEAANRVLGKGAAWLVMFMMLVQFSLVLMRYVFGTGSLFMQEAVVYAHGILFMTAAAWTLAADRHVRVDIFYGSASPRRRAMIDLFGVFAFLLPMCALVWWVGYPYVARSWAVWEGSREITGIPAVYLLKTFILLFAVSVALQGLVMAVRAAATLSGHSPGYGPRRDGQDIGRLEAG
jgi:TRAP-type mannitol/chloroaromatic compound transport system permease small subunit